MAKRAGSDRDVDQLDEKQVTSRTARVWAAVRVEKKLDQIDVDQLMGKRRGWCSLLETEQYRVKWTDIVTFCQKVNYPPVKFAARTVGLE